MRKSLLKLMSMNVEWVDFLIVLLSLAFILLLLNKNNILNVLLIGEIFWVIFFFLGTSIAVNSDSIFTFLISVYSLVIATVETCVGLSLIIINKNLFGSAIRFHNDKKIENFYKKKYFFFL